MENLKSAYLRTSFFVLISHRFTQKVVLETLSTCHKAVASANKILGMIRRTFQRKSKDLFVFLYRTYVRPHLENCVQLWSPYLAKDIDIIEKVQMRATKLVKGSVQQASILNQVTEIRIVSLLPS